MKSLSNFLASRAFFLLALIFAILCKAVIAYSYFSLVGDKSLYSLMSLNLVMGNGLTETMYTPGSSSPDFLVHPAVITPGYNLIQSFFLLLTGGHLVASSIAVEMLAWLLLLPAARKIILLFSSPAAANLAIMMIGCFVYIHELSSSVKDTLSVACMLWCLIFVVRICISRRSAAGEGLLLALFSFLPGIIKLAYLPLSVFFLLPVLIAGIRYRERQLKSVFFWALGLLALVVMAMLAFQSVISQSYYEAINYSGTFGMRRNPKLAGFYPSNLRHVFPFIVTTFINIDLIAPLVYRIAAIPYKTTLSIFGIINWILLIAVAAKSMAFVAQYRFRSRVGFLFSLTALFVSGALVTAQLLISLRYNLFYYKNGGFWTYVMEGRHYLYIMLILQLCTIILFARRSHFGRAYRSLVTVIFAILVVTCLHGIYFRSKAVLFSKGPKETASTHIYSRILEEVEMLRKNQRGKNIWLVTDIEHLKWLGLVSGHRVDSKVGKLKGEPNSLPQGMYVVVLYEEDATDFLQTTDARFWKTVNGYSLLILENQ